MSAARAVSPGRIWNRLLGDPRLFTDRATALSWLEEEHPNLYATVGEAHRAPLLTSVLRTQLGFAHRQRGGHETGADVLRAALDATREAGSPEAEATALEGLGLVLLDERDPRAAAVLRENLALASGIADERGLALARMHLAKVLEPDEALPLLDLAHAYFTAREEAGNVLKTDLWRGRKLTAAGRPAEARELLDRVASATGHHRERGEARLALADVALASGADPAPDLREVERIFSRFGFPREAATAAALRADLSTVTRAWCVRPPTRTRSDPGTATARW
ncbi:hypothetical protein [Amycolatopsis methanolica]|uniref:Uncharacterized protein n=1 Tax=Amycolatopsis methanolica 239 TaxID=1068978 RepID=A0A076MHJ9_AMYME|nr:hypothetical protein [Amycolatopsis methanolica]AIJ20159.1 hypothetical protein AMETH_0067 [Amycolatopsis methanolica 239]